MRPYVSNGVLIATGGVSNAYDSAFPSFFQCPDIDVVWVHDYDRSPDVATQLANMTQLARTSGKRAFIEEFSCDATQDFVGDPSWPVLTAHASNPPAMGFAWPELP